MTLLSYIRLDLGQREADQENCRKTLRALAHGLIEIKEPATDREHHEQ